MYTTQEIQEEIISEFEVLENKNDQYQYIIDLGRNLPPFPEEYRKDENLIKGCQSKVWLVPILKENRIYFDADSDSTLVKGLVSLLIRIFNGRTPQEILSTELFFIDRIGLKGMLSMNRANGLASMIQQIKTFARCYQENAPSLQ
ncbi:MAG: SufE family protein [Cytophagales bacterium]|nr:SufE family protein [Cytophagales bacterium]MDW8383762.1 SufE family protein [Flammeovirgaceae bacterium]